MFFIRIQSGQRANQKFTLECDRVTIGRSAANDIQIDTPAISGNHCLLQRAGQSWTLRDLGSTNGTFINNMRVKEARIVAGDTMVLGDVAILVGEESDDPDSQSNSAPEQSAVSAPPPVALPTAHPTIRAAPVAFKTRKDARRLWIWGIAAAGAAVLAALVYFAVKLFRSSNH